MMLPLAGSMTWIVPNGALVGPTLAYRTPRARSLTREITGRFKTRKVVGRTSKAALVPLRPEPVTRSITSLAGSVTTTLPTHWPEANMRSLSASTETVVPPLMAVKTGGPVYVRTMAPVEDFAVTMIRKGA